ncbi:hypothetical protein [Parasitella parasitica]|uniref:Spindle assembly checkpoint component MAD1 n=1 Tax=Parasitella parasitica TaxID=35722 RepID=A0A0B7NEK3_9FUNG|nr:hypothetical protein [Parasitella parasitica]
MADIPVKRKRVTTDILSFSSPNVTTFNTNSEKLKHIEALVNKLEVEKATLESKIKFAAVSHRKELDENLKTVSELVESKAENQKRAIYHNERYKDATKTLATMKEKHSSVANGLREQLETSRYRIDELESSLFQTTNEFARHVYSESEKTRQMSSEIKKLNMEVESLKQENQEKSSRIEEGLQREFQLTEKINSLEQQIHDISAYPKNPHAYQQLEIEYQSISKCALDLEANNVKLARELNHYKGISQNIELLRAEKESLSQRLTVVDEIREANFQLEMENIKLKAERAAWASYLESQPNVNSQSPEDIIYGLTQQAEKAVVLRQSIQQYQSQIEKQLDLIKGLEAHVNDLKKAIIQSERTHATDVATREILMKGTASFKRHISALESQLAMYDQAEMMEPDATSYDQIKVKRIQELEELLREHELQITSQAQELVQEKIKNNNAVSFAQPSDGPLQELESGVCLYKMLSELVSKEEKLLQDLEEKSINEALLQRQVQSAKERIEQVCKSIEDRERQMHILTPVAAVKMEEPAKDNEELSTDNQLISDKQPISDEPDVRILELLDNPASKDLAIRTSLLDRLEKENADLLDQIRSNNSNTDVVTVPKSTLFNLETKNQELQGALQSREKRIQRLHSIWEAKVNETSSQIRQLLGYNVIFRNDGVTRLESILVDPTELAFIVKIGDAHGESEKGMLRMVGSKKEHFMQQLEDIYRVYIIQDRNIPAFLSAAAQEFYVNAKQQDTAAEEDDVYMDEETEYDEGFEPYDEETRIHNDPIDDEINDNGHIIRDDYIYTDGDEEERDDYETEEENGIQNENEGHEYDYEGDDGDENEYEEDMEDIEQEDLEEEGFSRSSQNSGQTAATQVFIIDDDED